MTTDRSPYHHGGPFLAATAIGAWATAKLLGTSIRPEYKASVISDLIGADISVELAFEVSNVPDSFTPTPIDSVQTYVDQIENVGRQAVRLLEKECEQGQLRAFEIGYDLSLTRAVCYANWEQLSEGIAFVQKKLAKIGQYMTALGIDSSALFPISQATSQCSTERDLAALDHLFEPVSTKVAEFLWRLDNPQRGAPA